MIQAILVDLDDTILKDRELTIYAVLKTLSLVKTKMNIEISYKLWNDLLVEKSVQNWKELSSINAFHLAVAYDEIEGLWANYNSDKSVIQVLKEWIQCYRFNTWLQLLEAFGIYNKQLAMECSEAFIEHRRKYILYPEVIDALSALKSKFKLGLVTNGTSMLQRQKIRNTNIDSYFDSIAISEEVGRQKPDCEIFEYMCKELNVQCSECVMIGDDLEKDIIGAKTLGMYTIHIKRYENIDDSIINKDASLVCSNLRQATEWILREKERS